MTFQNVFYDISDLKTDRDNCGWAVSTAIGWWWGREMGGGGGVFRKDDNALLSRR